MKNVKIGPVHASSPPIWLKLCSLVNLDEPINILKNNKAPSCGVFTLWHVKVLHEESIFCIFEVRHEHYYNEHYLRLRLSPTLILQITMDEYLVYPASD